MTHLRFPLLQWIPIRWGPSSTGKSLGYKNNLSVNQALAVHNVGGMRLAIRASTYSTPGYATMAVDGANRIINVR